MSHATLDELERRRFVADPDVLAVLGMSVDDLADPDARSFVIRHEHPEFVGALEDDDLDEIDLGYGPMTRRLHLARGYEPGWASSMFAALAARRTC